MKIWLSLLTLGILCSLICLGVCDSSDQEFAKVEKKMQLLSHRLDSILAAKVKALRQNKNKISQRKSSHIESYSSVEKLEKKFEQQAVKEAMLSKIDARRAMKAASSLSSSSAIPVLNTKDVAAAVRPTKKKSKSKSSGLIKGEPSSFWRDRSEMNGLWKPSGNSPPYIKKVLVYSGEGVDIGGVNIIRKWFNFKLSWRDQTFHTDDFLNSFEGNHFRFVARSQHGRLIIPPLSSPIPEFSSVAGKAFKHFVEEGGNTVIVCGGPLSVIFLNSVLPWIGYHANIQPRWSRGPFEKQKPALHSRFQTSPIMLPGEDAWGVLSSSLPPEAASYFEAPDCSVVFALKAKKGQVIYVGSTFGGQFPQWKEVLMDAAQARGL